MWIALWLSQYKIGGLLHSIFKSFNRNNSQINSQVALERAMYSPCEDDLKIVTCFFAFHDMRDVLRKKQWPDVDLLVSKHHAQSASENPSNCISVCLENNKLMPRLVFKYLMTLQAALQ
jgi:hypothetical protein